MVQDSYKRVRLPSHHFPLNFMKDRKTQLNLKISSMNISWQKFWNSIRFFTWKCQILPFTCKKGHLFYFKNVYWYRNDIFFVNRQEIWFFFHVDTYAICEQFLPLTFIKVLMVVLSLLIFLCITLPPFGTLLFCGLPMMIWQKKICKEFCIRRFWKKSWNQSANKFS